MKNDILIFGASLRQQSFNKKLALVTQKLASHQKVFYRDFNEYSAPLFNEDIETDALPSGAALLVDDLKNSDRLVVSVPEYNGAISGVLKNLLDWASRADQNPLDGKKVLLLSASPGALGGVRGLWHTRVPFEAMGAFVYPEMFGLSKAHQAFNEQGDLTDVKNKERLISLIDDFLKF